jgi:hypothetical protein
VMKRKVLKHFMGKEWWNGDNFVVFIIMLVTKALKWMQLSDFIFDKGFGKALGFGYKK